MHILYFTFLKQIILASIRYNYYYISTFLSISFFLYMAYIRVNSIKITNYVQSFKKKLLQLLWLWISFNKKFFVSSDYVWKLNRRNPGKYYEKLIGIFYWISLCQTHRKKKTNVNGVVLQRTGARHENTNYYL